MKQIKRILLVLMAGIMALAIPFSAACQVDNKPDDTGNETPVTPPGPVAPVTTELLGITVDTLNARTEFYVGQNFTERGLVVKAETKRSDRNNSTTATVTNYSIDSSAYRNRVGEYEIKVSYTLGETTKEASYNVQVCDIILEINTSSVKKLYLEGETFSAAGLTATATTKKPNAEDKTVDVTDKITVDSSAVNLNGEGVYPVTVNYDSNGVVRSAAFDITVQERKEGLNVTLAEGVSDTVTLTSEAPKASIDPTKIVVRTVDDYGNVIETPDGLLSPTDYTVKVFNQATQIEATDLTNLGEGTYQIWVYKDSEEVQGYTLSGFALIYVIDSVTALEFVDGTTEQIAGNDTISETWTFKATYASGKEINLTAEDVVINIDTKTVGENKQATVTYSYINSKGETKTVETNVGYTIKEKPAQSGDVTYTMTYQAKFGGDTTTKVGVWETLWDKNEEDLDANVKFTSTTKNFGSSKKSTAGDPAVTFTDYSEIKAQDANSVTVSVGAKAKNVSITVYANTTNAGRTIYLTNNVAVGDNNANVLDYAKFVDTVANDKEVSKANLCKLTSTNLSSGNYYIFADNTIRLYAVVVEYTIENGGGQTAEPVSANIGDLVTAGTLAVQSYTVETKLAEGIFVTADSTNSVAVDASKKSYEADAISSTHRLKLSGSGSATARSLKIVTEGPATITVYMMSSSSTASRDVGLYDSNFAIIGTAKPVGGASLEKHEYTVTAAGTYYIAAASGGTNVYHIVVTPTV